MKPTEADYFDKVLKALIVLIQKTARLIRSSELNASVTSSCAHPPPGNCGAFACLVSPGGGALANLARPGARAFAYPRAFETHGVSNSKSKHGGFYR